MDIERYFPGFLKHVIIFMFYMISILQGMHYVLLQEYTQKINSL